MSDEQDAKQMLETSVTGFIDATAARTSTPGGGSVAGVVGALGVALGEMSLNFTRGKKKFAEHEDLYARVAGRLENARMMCRTLVADDMEAYGLYQTTMKMEDGPTKDEAMQTAVAAAIDVPRELTKLCLAVLSDLAGLSDKCSRWLISDLVAGGFLLLAAVKMSDLNVRINVPAVADEDAAREVRQSSADDCAKAAKMVELLETAAKEYL